MLGNPIQVSACEKLSQWQHAIQLFWDMQKDVGLGFRVRGLGIEFRI